MSATNYKESIKYTLPQMQHKWSRLWSIQRRV